MVSVRIPLTNNKAFASVSIEDASRVRQHRWHLAGNGYPMTGIAGRLVYLHHLILDASGGFWRDHRNRNRLDARRSNLRLATQAQSSWNTSGHAQSGYKGIWLDRRDGYWYANITAHGCKHSLGAYSDPQDAAQAYDAAARFYFGEFAYTNFDGDEALNVEEIACRNRSAVKDATSPYFGVRFDSRYKEPWLTRLSIGKHCVLRQRFRTAEDAARAYDAKVCELGLSRRRNFPKAGET